MMELEETIPEQSGCGCGSYTGGKRSQNNAWKNSTGSALPSGIVKRTQG